jgi:polysaccharide deacetylase family protein (PEP-CTERM system associated)
MIHALTIDVEDWSNATILLLFNRVENPSRAVVLEVERLLTLLTECGVSATWFVLGEIAEKYPALIKKLSELGHEIGVHGYYHYRLQLLTLSQFREQLLQAKNAVEQLIGKAVLGYRAPAFSVNYEDKSIFEILIECGIKYDSSVFPFKGRRYGSSKVNPAPHKIKTAVGTIWEIPPSVMDWGLVRLPCCGGGYFRHFPLWYTKWAMRHLEKRERAAIVYLHPYELQTEFDDAYFGQHLSPDEWPLMKKNRVLQYRNRQKTADKLGWLLKSYQFNTIRSLMSF